VILTVVPGWTFEFDPKEPVLIRIEPVRAKLPATVLLRALG